MCKIIFIKGKVSTTGRGGKYVQIYVHKEYGGKDLKQFIGKEVEGFVVIKE